MWFGLEPPIYWSRSKSAHKCVPYNNRCMQNFIQIGWVLAVRGPKTCFGVKTAKPLQGSHECLAINNLPTFQSYCFVVLYREGEGPISYSTRQGPQILNQALTMRRIGNKGYWFDTNNEHEYVTQKWNDTAHRELLTDQANLCWCICRRTSEQRWSDRQMNTGQSTSVDDPWMQPASQTHHNCQLEGHTVERIPPSRLNAPL